MKTNTHDSLLKAGMAACVFAAGVASLLVFQLVAQTGLADPGEYGRRRW
jgi:hypothetical protein